jgi:hypothetical protein
MPIINITNEVALAIRAAAEFPFRETGTQRPDGSWDVPIQQGPYNFRMIVPKRFIVALQL